MKLINKASKRSTPRGKQKHCFPFLRQNQIKELVKARKQARDVVMTDLSEHNKKHLNDPAEEIGQVLDKCKLDIFKTSCESLNPEISGTNLWKLIKHIGNKQQKINQESPSNYFETPTGEMKNSKKVSKDLGDNFSNVVISSIKPRIFLEKTLFMDTF